MWNCCNIFFLAKINGLVDNDLSEMNLGEALDALNEPAVW